ncbi:MAG: ClpX C4-type zinc finger protein [Fodinibius sp.]|nr:ClpX C4-type zinc finger protein [Fodinibius sp.]
MSDQENNDDKTIHCSFCGRSSHEVNSMVAGPNDVYICDRCVADASGIVKSDLASMSEKREQNYKPLLKPAEIKSRLDEYVIGQEGAKKDAFGCGL